MTVYATYCSASKVKTQSLVPAINLYQSKRIESVFQIAKKNNRQFIILSGKHGLLDPDDKILYYDHLLTSEEVKNHSSLVANQLEKKGITEILFYAGDVNRDINIQTYIDCISLATEQANISVEVKHYRSL